LEYRYGIIVAVPGHVMRSYFKKPRLESDDLFLLVKLLEIPRTLWLNLECEIGSEFSRDIILCKFRMYSDKELFDVGQLIPMAQGQEYVCLTLRENNGQLSLKDYY